MLSTQTGPRQTRPMQTEPSPNNDSIQILTDEIRTFIVQRLACFDTPSQVAEAVKLHFGVEITRQHAYAYDPRSSQRVGPRWRALHAATREAYLREVAETGIAQKTVRLAMLDRMAHHALANHATPRAAGFLEQAAKECGGIYENRRPVVLQVSASQPAETQSPAGESPARESSAPEQSAPIPAIQLVPGFYGTAIGTDPAKRDKGIRYQSLDAL